MPKHNRKICSLMGAMLINFVSRTTLYWGNLSVYAMSYAVQKSPRGMLIKNSWTLFSQGAGSAAAMILSTKFVNRIGPRWTVFGAILTFNCAWITGCFLYLIPWSAYVILFGLFIGFGQGIFLSILLEYYVICWADSDSGTLTAMSLAAPMVGTIFINIFSKLWINPGNLPPDLETGDTVLFSQQEIIDRIPSMFLMVTGVCLALQTMGFCLLKTISTNKTTEQSHKEASETACISMAFVSGYKVGNEEEDENEEKDYNAVKQNDLKHDERNENLMDSNAVVDCLTLIALLKRRDFQVLWVVHFFLQHDANLVMTSYKMYGHQWIKNDRIFQIVEAVAPIVLTFCIMLWGVSSDKLGQKNSLILAIASSPILTLLMYFTAIWNQWVYLITTITSMASNGASFVLMTVSAIKFSENGRLGLANALFRLSLTASAFTASALTELMVSYSGWFAAFAGNAFLCLPALLLTVLFLKH